MTIQKAILSLLEEILWAIESHSYPIEEHGEYNISNDYSFKYEIIPKIKKAIDDLALQPRIPEGYVLVPVEPTEEMIDAATEQRCLDCSTKLSGYNAVTAYKSIISSAPKGEGR